MSAIDDARRVAADMLRQVGDEEGARVVERLSTPWEMVEIEDPPGFSTRRFNVVRDFGGDLDFAPEAEPFASGGFTRADAQTMAEALNRLTRGIHGG